MNPELYDLEFADKQKTDNRTKLFDADKKLFAEMVTFTFTERLKTLAKYKPTKIYEGTPEWEEYYAKRDKGEINKAPKFRDIKQDKLFVETSISVGIDMLRHSYIMYMYPKLKTIKEKEDLARRMLHSAAQQEKYNLVGKEDEEMSEEDKLKKMMRK
jgi:hypothetical protein